MPGKKEEMDGTVHKNTQAQPAGGDFDDGMTASQSAQGQPEETAFWKDKFARLYADLDNTKKRLARTSAQEVEAQKETLLRELLPVADGLDLALLHTSEKHDNRDIMQGIELVREILNKFFAKYNVKAIDAWGKPFDPRLHEAIGVVPHPKFPPNTVVKVEQKGYLHGDKLLRPAQVVVTPS